MTRLRSEFPFLVLLIGISFWMMATQCYAEDAVSTYNFSGKDTAALVVQAMTMSGLKPEDIQLHIQGIEDADRVASADAPITATIENLHVDKAHAQWEAVLHPRTDAHDLPAIQLTGRYDEVRMVPTLVRALNLGEVVSKDDIEWTKQPAAHVHPNTIMEAQELIGKLPRHVLSAHRPIRQDEIAGSTMVSKGARVAMVFKAGNLSIKTVGEALDSGASGDVIRVRNIESKSIVQGVVEAAGRVRVGSPDTNTAELP